LLLDIPQPYDFQLSTARFRDFGSDGATVLHEGGLHRVVSGREVRVTAAAGGVAIEPWSEDAASEIGQLLGVPFDLAPFRAWAAEDPVLGPIVDALAGFRPTLNPQPFEALVVAITTQQISLRAAAAIRGNLVRAYGVQHEVAWEFPTRERIKSCGRALHTARVLAGEGGVRPRARALGPRLRRARRARRRRGHRRAHLGPRARPLDGRLVPRAPPRRPHAWPAGDLGVRKAVSTFYAGGSQLSIEEVRRMSERIRAVREPVSAVPARRRLGWRVRR
jgi:3-methyladenine DNA glycosylase/8-oxoguanine DNA glycosylase